MDTKKISRRDMLRGLGAMGALSMAGPLMSLASCAPGVTHPGNTGNNTSTGTTGSQANLSPDCALTPSQVEGLYYIKASQIGIVTG